MLYAHTWALIRVQNAIWLVEHKNAGEYTGSTYPPRLNLSIPHPLFHHQFPLSILKMHTRKTYFILPTTDYTTTHIQLGQIITNLHLPYRPLSAPLNTPAFPLPTPSTAFKAHWTFSHASALSGSLGLQAQILAQLGSPIGADATVSGERSESARWVVERL